MRSIRPVVMIVVAATIALAAVSVAAVWLKKNEELNTIKVVVATRDLQIGTKLQPGMLETVMWPSAAPIKSPLTSTEQALDRVVNMPVLRGEPILETKLAAVGQQGGLSSVLKDGKRAVTVKVNEIVGVAGFALPGNYVDVMANIPDKDNNPISKIVLERIQILAVAQDIANSENKPRVVSAVTLEVTPQEAEIIDLARSVGSLSLVLRSQIDVANVETSGSRKADLLHRGGAVVKDQSGRNNQMEKSDGSIKNTRTNFEKIPIAKSIAAEKLEVIRGINKTHESAQ